MKRNENLSRRRFMQVGAAGIATLSLQGPTVGFASPADSRPNFLFIVCDQMILEGIAAYGCPGIHTPHLDSLAGEGYSFMESYSTNPVCSPARSSLFTGRMPVETGVITNNLAIADHVPNMGEWFGERGYDSVYCGKWHLWQNYLTRDSQVKGFRVLPAGNGEGDMNDSHVAACCEAYLHNRRDTDPFLLVASFLQPHDICYYNLQVGKRIPPDMPYERFEADYPPLPPNTDIRPPMPELLEGQRVPEKFDAQRWRYYLYVYHRMIEMLDADVGRLLQALESSGHRENTVVVFTSDHGDGAARHDRPGKWTPYEETSKVPLIIRWPGRVEAGVRDHTHLVTGVDIMSTFCDYAGIEEPPKCRGRSLRPLLEGRGTEWREYAVVEFQQKGRMVRTARYKYAVVDGDKTQALFDLKEDPWETRNLLVDSPDAARHEAIAEEHLAMLKEYDARMEYTPITESMKTDWVRQNFKVPNVRYNYSA